MSFNNSTNTNQLTKQNSLQSPSSLTNNLNSSQSPTNSNTTTTTASLTLPSSNLVFSKTHEQLPTNGNNNDYTLVSSFPNIQFSNTTATLYSEDANKAFDDVVFDILKVDPDHIAGQLTLIDLPLFKLIEPDELISCKWMSREKLIKAPNIVQFTRRFNQTAFWCQKEILNCKRIERRGKMVTHFIKIAKRLNELHSFNSLMAIIVALKSAPIYRLKKTWTQHVSKRDVTFFERMSDIMFDTSDNKRKIRDMHMNCKLPCIPFLGLFLTDLIHIDIAHPHNAFDNPQRRNQMNNICRLISEYQQSNYQDLTLLSCSCCFTSTTSSVMSNNQEETTSSCITPNCSCDIHHGHGYGGGIINNDGTIYISEISYVKNYLNSFLYIEELQKFKEDDNYRESLELEPEPSNNSNSNSHSTNTNSNTVSDLKLSDSLQPTLSTHFTTSSPCKLNQATNNNFSNKFGLTSTESASYLIKPPNLINETKDLINDLKLKHPLDDSIVERLPSISLTNSNNCTNTNTTNNNVTTNSTTSNLPNSNSAQQTNLTNLLSTSKTNLDTENNNNNNKSTNKLNDPSLLKSVLRQRHINGSIHNNSKSNVNDETSHKSNHSHHYLRNKFSCYSSNTTDMDDTDDDEMTNHKNNVNNINESSLEEKCCDTSYTDTKHNTPTKNSFNLSFDSATNKTGSKSNKHITNSVKTNSSRKTSITTSDTTNSRRLSGRNLTKSLNEEKNSTEITTSTNGNDKPDGIVSHVITPNLSNSDLFRSSLHDNVNEMNRINNTDLSSLSSILGGIEHHNLKAVLFESPVKRKCIIKNFIKPRFSQWKTYWLQLIGGNLLVYYPTKSVISFNSLTSNQRRNSTSSNHSYFMVDQFQLDSEIKSVDEVVSTVSTNSIEQQQKQEKLHQLQSQLQQQKVLFNKNPCKMHPIASWMVVNLFQDKENEILAQQQSQTSSITSNSSSLSSNSSKNTSNKYHKFDIQLNDLNNGNMYKYRFDSLQLAKEWYEQFKLASTFHERQKPDNLIRFD